jgi:hypothetical protein
MHTLVLLSSLFVLGQKPDCTTPGIDPITLEFTIIAEGSNPYHNHIELISWGPTGSYGYYFASRLYSERIVPGYNGTLCLKNPIYRYNQPHKWFHGYGPTINWNTYLEIVDPLSHGETWLFQGFWYNPPTGQRLFTNYVTVLLP